MQIQSTDDQQLMLEILQCRFTNCVDMKNQKHGTVESKT